MDKGQAIDQFWNSFGWQAYDENTTPEDQDLPDNHITYDFVSDALDANTSMHATIWDRSESWKSVTLKAEQIAEAIANMEKPIKIDTGYVWIKRGEPFAQRIDDDTDDMARGVYINITVEYLTEY